MSLMILLALVILLIIAALLGRRRAVVLRVPARLESIRPLADIVDEMAREADLGEKAAFHCRLALDEACTNIIEHSYAHQSQGEIEAVIEAGHGKCAIHLTDFGAPYDPGRVEGPPRSRSLDELPPGGLGLHIMRSVMDEVRYRPGPRGNRLTMIKRRQSFH